MKKSNRKKLLDELKQYIIKSEAEMNEVLWLIKEGVFKNVQEYIDSMTLLINGKAKDVNGRYININKLRDAALIK